MTVLVVVRKGDRACIAADTQTILGNIILPGDHHTNNSRSKIVHFRGSYIGLSGSSAHHRVFKSIIKQYPEQLNFEGADNIFETFRNIHTILKDEYYILSTEGEDEDQPYESNQMCGVICNQTGIYDFDSYREVAEVSQYWASGSGMQIALGALYVGYQLLEDVEEIAHMAVSAACKLDCSCGLPLESYLVKLKG
jgi:ATP-dependent protease HslVU (ClpYQ) peptidase subunit